MRICGGFCHFNHLARAIPTPLAFDALQMFDADVRQCFLKCMAITIPDASRCQVQLPLHLGGLGLPCLSHHASAASYSSSGCCNNEDAHLNGAIDMFNEQVAFSEKISFSSVTSLSCSQKALYLKLDGFQFQQLIVSSHQLIKHGYILLQLSLLYHGFQ